MGLIDKKGIPYRFTLTRPVFIVKIKQVYGYCPDPIVCDWCATPLGETIYMARFGRYACCQECDGTTSTNEELELIKNRD